MQAHLGAALPIAPSPGLASAAFATPPRPSSPSKCKLNLQHDPESSSADVCQQPTSAAAEFPPQPPVSQAPRCAAAVYGRAPEAFTGPCTALPSSSASPSPSPLEFITGAQRGQPPRLFQNLSWTRAPFTTAAALPAAPVPRPAAVADVWHLRRDGHELTPSRPFCLEICAGSGRLTAELRRRGLDAWALDHKGGRLAPETAAILYVDLALACDVLVLHKLLAHPQLVYIHFRLRVAQHLQRETSQCLACQAVARRRCDRLTIRLDCPICRSVCRASTRGCLQQTPSTRPWWTAWKSCDGAG